MPYGMIAGSGRFPVLALEAARRLGVEVVTIAIEEEALFERLDATYEKLKSAKTIADEQTTKLAGPTMKEDEMSLVAIRLDEVVQYGWLWDELLVFHHSFYVHAEGFACELACFFQSFTSGNATGEVRETYSEIGVAIFVQVGDVMHGLLL